MKFKYAKFQGRLLPIILIRLKGKEWVKFRAFVDSGAGYSVFQAEIAEILGLELEKGDKGYLTVGDGSQIKIYFHKIFVEVADRRFKATVAFSRHLGIGFNIIGRKDIFERFKVCFDEKKKIVEFIA